MDAEYFFSNSSTPMTPEYPWYYINRETIIPGVGDHNAALILPIIAYWITSLTYAYIDWADWEWLAQYRVQPASDADKKNLVTKSDVLWTVFKMQAIQSILGWTIYHFRVGDAPPTPNHVAEMQAMAGKIGGWMVNALSEGKAGELMAKYSYQIGYYGYWWAAPAARMLAAMLILDAFQYWAHRSFHAIPFLYKHVHSVHHRLYVPYAFGSQYNHPFEGGVVDTIGAVLGEAFAGLNERETIFLIVFVTYKAVEDHCGYNFPFHPLRLLTSNNAEFHEIHHQVQGLKTNFSQPLFINWDRMLGTHMSLEELNAKKASRKAKTQ